MYSGVEQHVIYQIANAPVREHPFPHMSVDSVFPQDFYAKLRGHWPAASSLVSLSETGRVYGAKYAERLILTLTAEDIERLPPGRREFWSEFAAWFLGHGLFDALMLKFDRYVQARFGEHLEDRVRFFADALVIKDLSNYSLGPHTDNPRKVLALVFYCPDNAERRHLGTSIYVPKDPAFRCKGGPHYDHALFTRAATMEYRPNSLFAFFKTDRSFHGVERITDSNVERDLLLYDVRAQMVPVQKDAGSAGLASWLLRRILRSKA